MKRKNKLFVFAIPVVVIIAISLMVNTTKYETIENPNPRSEDSWVGDVMPFYDKGTWNIFYLEDHRDGNIGFHPFSLFTTDDFVHYKDYGTVIPYINEESSQERALGTGSIIRGEDGLYHAFYTAHNGELTPKEAIMHATSKNLKDWTKHEEEMFFGSEQYQNDDFRDPFVFFNEEENKYWMLITTRKNNMGVIAKYSSDNLTEWTDEGVFFENDMGSDGNLECPSLVEYNGKWYLAFSDQWPDRVTHYRVADSPSGAFEKPESLDHWDANAFYAGQIQKDDDGNLFVFAWVPTKEEHSNNKPYNWAGNLSIHQLEQDEKGNLFAKAPESVLDYYQTYNNTELISDSESLVKFKQTDNLSILEGKVTFEEGSHFGFSFNTDEQDDTGLNILFEDNKIAFYNNLQKYIPKSEPLSRLEINSVSDTINFKLLINYDIVTVYINEEQAFSTRMLNINNKDFNFFVTEGRASLILDEK